MAKYRDKGLEVISGNHYGGNHRNLSFEEETEILAPFKARAEKGELVEIREIERRYASVVSEMRYLQPWRKSLIVSAIPFARFPLIPFSALPDAIRLLKHLIMFQYQDDIPEEEKSEWAMDIPFDMDECFRQHDLQYAADHPDAHAAKEEIYEKPMVGRISALDEKLAAMGQTENDYLPSEIEKFKDATGYEEWLDFAPAEVKAMLDDPDKSHINDMLSFAEKAEWEYAAEAAAYVQTPADIVAQARAVYGEPDAYETDQRTRSFAVTDRSREQMEAAGYGYHHSTDDGKYLIKQFDTMNPEKGYNKDSGGMMGVRKTVKPKI